MKATISKLLLIICFLCIHLNSSFSQQNFFVVDNDTTKAYGTYYDQRESNNKTVNYLKHFLTAQLKVNLMSDTSYMASFYNFLNSENAILRNTEIDRFGLIDIRLSDTSDAINYVDTFSNSGLFEYIYPTAFGEQNGDPTDPTDPQFINQWYLKQPNNGTVNKDIDAKKAWVITKGAGTNILYYILDSGIMPNTNGNISHNDLNQANITNLQDFTGTGWNTAVMHGTQVTGVVGAEQNNGVAIAGLGPAVRILMYKTWNVSVGFSLTPIINALRAVVDYKRQSPNYSIVVSASFSTTEDDFNLRSVIQSCDSLNIMGVYSTGNNADTMRYPAKYARTLTSVISVGGTNRDDGLYPQSNYARTGTTDLILVAPAQEIVTTDGTGTNAFTSVTGTSLAAPLVGGTIAMMYTQRPLMTKTQVRNKLIRGCDKPAGMAGQNYTTHYGYGRLNTFNCVSLCLDSVTGTLGTINTPVPITRNIRIYGNTNVLSGSVVSLQPGYTIVLDKFAHLCFEQYGKIKLLNGSTFIQRRLSTVCDRGEFVIDPLGCYLVEDSANFFLTGPGPGGPSDGGCMAVWGGTLIVEDNATLNINKGAFMTIRNGGKVILGINSKINFGGTSWLQLNEGGNMVFNENSGLKFKDSSYIYADTEDSSHIYFSGINDTTRWNGIFFDSSIVNDTLEKCVFSGAKTSITIRNSITSSNVSRIIKNNIFNVPSGEGNIAIDGENTHKITIQDNIFNMPVTTPGGSINVGVFLKNVNPSSGPINIDPVGNEDNADNQMVYILNIINNIFNKGSASMVLANYTSSFPPYYIKGNYFDDASSLNILGLKIT